MLRNKGKVNFPGLHITRNFHINFSSKVRKKLWYRKLNSFAFANEQHNSARNM